MQRYLTGLASLVIAFLLSLLLEPLLKGQHPYVLFIPAVLVTAWYGRFGPALVVLVGGYVVADFFFATPLYALGPFTPEALVSILTYATVTLVGIILVEAVHRARDRLHLAQEYGLALQKENQERKQAEQALQAAQEQLRAHADELERRVAERTASLNASLKALEGVLYHVAHDLRGPLRAMHGFTHLLLQERTGLTPSGETYAQRIHEAAGLMDNKIRDLLEYGRLGYQQFVLTSVDLSPIVKNLLVALNDRVQQRKAEVRVDQPLPAVCADAQVLEQALAKLLTNALTFVPSSTTPKIHIWSEEREGQVRLCIQDNGIGIAPEYQEKIFGLFEKLHDPAIFPGTGMGLAIAKKAIESIGGRIGVQSEPGQGSMFWIELSRAGTDLLYDVQL